MTASTLKLGTNAALRKLLGMTVATIGETLSSLVGREIQVHGGELQMQEPDRLVATLPRASAIARGAMDKGYAGKSFMTGIELPDAITMAGLLMMTPDDVILQRREGELEGEDVEAFQELGNVLYSGFSNALRAKVGNFELRMQDHGVVETGSDPDGILGTASLVTFGFRMKVGEFPESQGFIAIDTATAERWNKGPLEPGSGEAGESGSFGQAFAAHRADDAALEKIPLAPIRGILSAFVIQTDVFRTLRLSCRRVGLELRRHGRGEIPNPAAHRDQIVVLDVPPGEERRFDWCRRIKELSESTNVVLLIHHASRARVTQAFLSRADAILGFPCQEQQLSQKLAQLAPEASSDPEPESDSEPEATPDPKESE